MRLRAFLIAICLALAPSKSVGSAFGGTPEEELQKYSEILMLLEERNAEQIHGDFVRFIVYGRDNTPISFLVTGGDDKGIITHRETRRVPYPGGKVQLIKKNAALILPPFTASNVKQDIVAADFFSRSFTVDSDCFHAARYWLEARIGDQSLLIARGCDGGEAGARAVTNLIKIAILHFCYEDMSGIPFPGFPSHTRPDENTDG